MLQTIEKNHTHIQEQRRYDDFESQRRIIDEVTEASEKLAMVMHNSFEFELRPDGELYFQDGSVGDVLRKSVLVAEEIVKTNPLFMTELIRRKIELQEYDEQRRLALGSGGDADVLVVLSPIPDAVMAGADLGAYDKTRMKTLARIYERTEAGIRSTSLSLDGTDRAGLQAVARQFNQSITDDDTSEDILAKRFWGYTSVLHDPAKTVRRRYDEQLERQYGGQWYGGRQDGEVIDALSFIQTQADIVVAHMARMAEIGWSDTPDQRQARKAARYDFAAALDRRRHGASTLGDGGDLSGSGDAARSAGIEYSSDCPDGAGGQNSNGSTTESAVNEMFGRTKKEFISQVCPMCGDRRVLTKIEGSVISGSCGCARDICTGEEISINRRKNRAKVRDHEAERAKRVEAFVAQAALKVDETKIKQAYGEYAQLRSVVGIGSRETIVYDRQTGQVIDTLR